MVCNIKSILLYSVSLLMLSSCIPAAVIGGAGLVGYSMVQERTVGDAIDDIAIETEINALYLAHENKDMLLHVDIDSVEGRVLLTGSVPTRQAKVEAYKLAWRPDAVKEVINELAVNSKSEFSATQVASDTWISTQIESQLLFAEDVSSINYSVETINGVVYLMGVAKNKEELKKVAEITSTVSGVKKVVSYVRIKGKEYPKSRPKNKTKRVEVGNSDSKKPRYLEQSTAGSREDY